MPTARKHAKREIVYREVDKLHLDPENPRITANLGTDPDKLLAWMLREEVIDELALSIAENGYFSEEPLVVVPDLKSKGNWIVVEGNRRLAALKLLLDDGLRAKLGAADWPQLTHEQREDLKEVPTVEYLDRSEVVPYLGFRHITGVKTWDPFAKARYVAQLIDGGGAIADIEQGIGDSAGTVKKLYQAVTVYNQAVTELSYPAKVLRSDFSLLEVTLGQAPLKKHLGLPRELPTQKVSKLIDEAHLNALGEVLSWVFGNPDAGELKVISESRQIAQKLAPVVADQEALDYLRKHRDLEGAYERSGGELQFLKKQLSAANRASQRALGVAPNHKGVPEIKTEVSKLKNTVDALEREVK